MQIRAHHGMCLAFFVGKGYSGKFTKNMARMKELLETENPVVEIVCKTDEICSACPNNLLGRCISAGQVKAYDEKVLECCGMQAGQEMKWLDFSGLVREKVLETGKRTEICGDCSWNELCCP